MVTKAPAKVPTVTSWSFSRYSDYKTCPYRFKEKHLLKKTEPPNAAMLRGAEIHTKAEHYTKGKLKTLPPELKLFEAEFKALKKEKVKFIEEQWAFTQNWDLTQWSNWSECWVRIKLDAAYINTEHNALVVIDHKTGTPKDEKNDEYREQLELYGLAGLVQQPEVKVVSPRLWYLDAGEIYPNPEEEEIEYTRADEPKLKKLWANRVKPMFNDRTFAPKPSNACRWCPFSKEKGGTCKY